MNLKILVVILMIVTDFVACSQKNTNTSMHNNATKEKDMKSMISIFEIPAVDFARAVGFYQSVLDLKIEEIDMQGTQMGLFPSDGKTVSGVIIKGEGYNPSADGVVIYLNGGDDLQNILDKIEVNGGRTLVAKTLIDEENGYFAMFLDTEGNKIGLHSLN